MKRSIPKHRCSQAKRIPATRKRGKKHNDKRRKQMKKLSIHWRSKKKKKSTVDATEYSSRHFRTSSRAGFHPLPLLISCQFLRIINRLIIRRIISGVTSARPTSAGLQRQPCTHIKKRRTDNSHCARKPLLTATGKKKEKRKKELEEAACKRHCIRCITEASLLRTLRQAQSSLVCLQQASCVLFFPHHFFLDSSSSITVSSFFFFFYTASSSPINNERTMRSIHRGR